MDRSKLLILPLALSLSALILISSLINQGQSQILEDNNNTLALPQVFSRSANSVVQINVLNPTLNATEEDTSVAAGFIYDREGHVVTTLSAVSDGADLLITFLDGSTYNATLIGSDPFSDLAVLSTDSIPEDKLVPLPLGNSTELQIGEQVAAIGNPFGFSGVLTEGVIGKLGAIIPSVEEEEAEEEAVDEDAEVDTPSFSIPDIIVSDVPINPGNAGGPLLNTKGEVVGINAAVFSTGDFAGISLSVPSDTLKKIVPILITNGSYAHPWLGISGTDITPQIAEVLDLEMPTGFLITDLAEGGPAEKADIRGGDRIENISGREVALGGDIVVAIDNKTVRKIDDILNHLQREKDVGDMVSLTIHRGGQNMNVNVILDKRIMTAPATTSTTEDNITITDTNLLNFLTYENSTYGIRIQYPPDWGVDETDDYPDDGVTDIVQLLSPFEGRLDNYQENVFVSTEPLPQQDIALSTYADQLIDYKNQTINGFKLIEIDTTSTLGSNNDSAYNMTYYETGDDGIQYRTLEVGTIIGDKVYYISYFAEVDKYSDYLPVVAKMINSFDVISSSNAVLINNQTSSRNDTITLINKGDDSVYNFQYEQAITYYDKALGVDPNNIDTLSGKAYALSELNRYQEAVSVYDKALVIKPTNVTLLHSKASLLPYLGKYEEAVSVYDKILSLDPDNVDALFNKGFDLGQLGRHEEAVSVYDKALTIDPNDIGSLYHKAIALNNLARHEEAVSVYDKILSLKPIYETNLDALKGKANALFDLGRYEEAISTYDELLAIEPNMVNANISKADALSNLGRYEEAISEYEKVLEYYPEEVSALEGKGNALFSLGGYEEANIIYDKILAIEPDNVGALEKRQLVLDAINKVNVTNHGAEPRNNNSSITNITTATNVSTS